MPLTGLPVQLTNTLRGMLRLVAATMLLSECGGADLVLPGGQEPTSIRMVQGDGESGQVRGLVSLVVEVTDARGQPIEGVSVAFDLTSAGAGAEIAPPITTTDAAGHARTQMLLGTSAGLQTGDARVVIENTTVPKASFTVVVLPRNPNNRSPNADYNWHCESLSCQFTDASSDSDGSVTNWDWSFGDGGTSSETGPSHSYLEPGTYTVALTITDNDGASDVSESHVTVSAPESHPNKAPHAEFEVHCTTLTCTFIDKSKDDDGRVVGWLWDFGDGLPTSTEQNPAHGYAGTGHYPVTLTITDDGGAVDIKTHNADAKE